MNHEQICLGAERLAKARGLLVHRCLDSRKCSGTAGFPDLVIVGGRGLIFAEIKAGDDETTWAQDAWRWQLIQVDGLCSAACDRAGVLHRIWRQSDLELGVIADELAQIASR